MVPTLDQKLWVALACPARGIEFDERTLDLIDTDHDGRIRAPEMIAAVNWTVGLLKKTDDLLLGRASLPLAAIADTEPEGKEILASAHAMLGVVGKADATEISLQDPYAEKPSRGPYYLGAVLLALGLLAAAWRYGWLAPWLTP